MHHSIRRAWLTALFVTLLGAFGLTFAGTALASTVPAGTSTLALPAGSVVDPDAGSVTLGVQFTASVNGKVDGVAFRKGTTVNTGRNVQLWDASTRTKLASSTFYTQSQLGTGLVYQPFATPVAITAGHTYIASYLAPVGRYNALNNAHTTAQTSGPLTAPVNAGVYTYGSTVAFPSSVYQSSDYQVTPVFESTQAPPPPPANQPPVASFTATPSGLGVAVDGSKSSDPDGTVAGYSWNWGDGSAAGTGVTASHTYAAAGTYTVALTVTDNAGATGSSSQPVTVGSAPPPPPPGTLTGWQLTTSNVGLAPFGLSCGALPAYTGSMTVPAGTTLSQVRITGKLDLHLGNITVSKSCIQPTNAADFSGWEPLVSNTDWNGCCGPSATQVHVVDSEIDGSLIPAENIGGSCGFHGVGDIERDYIHGMGTGICFRYSGNAQDDIALNNYVSGLRNGSSSHNEGGTIRDFETANAPTRAATVQGNFFDSTGALQHESGAFFMQAIDGPIDNVTLSGNLFKSNGYDVTLYWSTYGYGRNVNAVNNRFVPQGYGPVATDDSGHGYTFNQWSSNYLYDPAAADGQGAVVAHP